MAFSRVMGMVYISTLMLGQVVSTYYGENEVNWRSHKMTIKVTFLLSSRGLPPIATSTEH